MKGNGFLGMRVWESELCLASFSVPLFELLILPLNFPPTLPPSLPLFHSPPAYAFVTFDDWRDAEDAVRAKDNYQMQEGGGSG